MTCFHQGKALARVRAGRGEGGGWGGVGRLLKEYFFLESIL